MKKFIGIGIAAMMVMGLAAGSANAYRFKIATQNFGTGQIWSDATSNTGVLPPASSTAEARFGFYVDNVVTAADPTLLTLKVTGANSWYGKVWGTNGFADKIDLRVFAFTSTTYLPASTWYLYKGIGVVDGGKVKDAVKVAEATFDVAKSAWDTSTFGYQFNSGDQFTISAFAPSQGTVVTPEPGSVVAMLSGLAGLAGYAIRRRK